jgi:hypothetical protein
MTKDPGRLWKRDVAHVKADFFSVEFTADFWYLSVVSGAKRTPIKTSNNIINSRLNINIVYIIKII